MFDIYNEDCLEGLQYIEDASVDLIVADPPYCLGKDYGNTSDMLSPQEFLEWTQQWIIAIIPKMKDTGSFYIFTTWRYAPEIFCFMKHYLTMINEIIWDRKVPSMGGSTRKFSSVHDNIGFFVKDKKQYYFDLDAVRIPYDPETKKARTRAIFAGKKWLEMGCNPKDVWSISRLHKLHKEREEHPTQKPLELIERMVQASCPKDGIVLDPFAGSGTTIEAAAMHNRHAIGFEINPEYYEHILNRLSHSSSVDQSKVSNLVSLQHEG